jgi:hypothetical protein
MPKRSTKYPYRASTTEQRLNQQGVYRKLETGQSRINPIFTEKPHYNIQIPKEEKQ